MIICLGATPAVQRIMIFEKVVEGAVNRAAQTVETIAGKSVNVAKVVKTLGERPLAMGFLGGDRGRFMREEMERVGIEHDFVEVGPRTRLCVTVMDKQAGTHTELVEESAGVKGGAWDELRAKLSARIEEAKVLALSGTLTPGAPVDFYEWCVGMAADANVPSIVDGQKEPLLRSLAARPLLVKPNRSELATALAVTIDSETKLKEAMRELAARGARNVLISMGGEGAILSDGQQFWRIVVPKVEVVNTIGSGDSATAGIAVGLVRGIDLPEACRVGMACGVANALTLHPADVRVEDVERLKLQVRIEAA